MSAPFPVKIWSQLTACSVDNTGSGSVVICIVLPTMFEMTNISMPILRKSQQRTGDPERPLPLHFHAYLPSSASVGRSSDIIRMLLVLENVRLALERQSDGLQTGRDQPDNDANLLPVSHKCLSNQRAPYSVDPYRDASLRRQVAEIAHCVGTSDCRW